MKISRRDRNLLIFTALFCAFLIYGNYVFMPQFDRIRSLQEEIAKKEQTITETLSAVNDIDSKVSSSQTEISSMLDVIPYTKDTESLLKSLDSIIAAGGIQQVSISFGEESKPEAPNNNNNNTEAQKPEYNIIPVDISLKGTYGQAVNTLVLLEGQKRLFNYKNVGMTADENGNINLNLSLEYYSMGRDMEVDTQRIEGSGKKNPFEPIIKPETPAQGNVTGSTPQSMDDILNQEFQKIFESMFQGIIQGPAGQQGNIQGAQPQPEEQQQAKPPADGGQNIQGQQ